MNEQQITNDIASMPPVQGKESSATSTFPSVEQQDSQGISYPSEIWKVSFWQSFRGDKVIWRIIIALAVVSLLVVFSSTVSLAYRTNTTPLALFLKQLRFFMASVFVVYVAHHIAIKWYRSLSRLLLAIAAGLLLITYIPGMAHYINGAPRGVNLFGFIFHYAELIKVALILYLAKVLEENAEKQTLNTFKQYFWHVVFPVGSACLLLIQRKCTSAALLIGFTAFIVLFIARLRNSYLWKTAVIGIIGYAAITSIAFATADTKLECFSRVKTMTERRIFPFLGIQTHTADNEQAKDDMDRRLRYQATQAQVAIASGGLFGKGPGNSTQRNELPNAYDDYVFAIIVEEYGLVGGLTIVFLYLILLFRTVVIARSCTRIFPIVAVFGLITTIVFQAMLHVAVTVDFAPTTGHTLPFVSLGGTSLLTTGFALGIILSISRATEDVRNGK